MPQVRTVRINGQSLRDLRTRRGLSAAKLAKKIGRARQSVVRLECDGTASLVFAYQLANALGLKDDNGQPDFSAFVLADEDEAEPEPGEKAA